MQQAQLDAITLDFEDMGTGDPVVLIHGALIADAYVTLCREEQLASRFRLITYRRRGYGGSTKATNGLTLMEQAADCNALVEHLGVSRAHVIGIHPAALSPFNLPSMLQTWCTPSPCWNLP
jgi:pimeloyl-ACP methyl ester carboxylesterase